MRTRWIFLIVLGLATESESQAGPFGAKFAEKETIDYTAAFGMGTGVSAADYDDDGDIDLFVPTGQGYQNLLLRNRGDGSFERVQESANLRSLATARAGLWFDLNGDGRLDLVTAGDRWGRAIDSGGGERGLRFYEQSSIGKFVEVTEATGVDSGWISEARSHVGGLCAGDVNNDGFIDLLVCTWGGGGNRLYLNHGGSLTEIATPSVEEEASADSWQPIMTDIDRDGWADVYSAIDFAPNAFWINQRNRTFLDRAFATGTDNHMNDMGTALADYDNDGDFDFFVTNIERTATHSILLRNDTKGGVVRFSELARESGIEGAGWGWGCTFFDANNDGWQDLAVTNGWHDPNFYLPDRSCLFQNSRGQFLNVSEEVNFDDTLWGSSLIAVDIDGDGDDDLVQTCLDKDRRSAHLRILENQLEQQNRRALTVRPRMRGSNRFAVGATVRLDLDSGITLSRQISAGCSFLGQEPYEARFGIGSAQVLGARISWPNGTETKLGPQHAGATISPVNERPNRVLDVIRSRGNKVSITWHGGELESANIASEDLEWAPVLTPPNPLLVPLDGSRSAEFFRLRPNSK